jgi:hypothetical protein
VVAVVIVVVAVAVEQVQALSDWLEQYEMFKLAWTSGIKKGHFAEVDSVINGAMGIK